MTRYRALFLCGWFVALCFVTAPALRAQPAAVQGQVTDAATGEPLYGATVDLGASMRGTAADLRGHFLLGNLPTGAVRLRIRSLGYTPTERTVTLTPGDTLRLDVALTPLPLEGDAVVVTAARRVQAAADAPVSVHVLTAEDLTRALPVTLDEALRTVPGVQLTENQVNVRGSSGFAYGVGSRVALLVDNQPMLAPDQGNIKFDTFPLGQIERIEIVKGPGSALYGGGALGGVVHLITRPFPTRPAAEVTLHGGAWAPVGHAVWRDAWTGGNAARPFAGAEVFTALPLGHRAGAWTHFAWRDDPGYAENSATTQQQGYGKLGWHPTPSLRLDVFGGHAFTRSEVFLFWRDGRNPLRVADGDFVDGGDFITSYYTTALPSLTHVLSPTFSYTVRGRYFRGQIIPLDGLGRPRPEARHTLGLRYGGEVQATWQPAAPWLVTGGLSADEMAGRSRFFAGLDGSGEAAAFQRGQPEAAAYLQLEKLAERGPLPRLHATTGLRFDYYTIDGAETVTQLSPKLNAAWHYSDRLTARASFGLGFRVPSIAERFIKNAEHLPLEPNPLLRPEASTGAEVGARGKTQWGERVAVDWDVAGFWTHYRRLVEPRFVETLNAFRFENLTRARIYGAEAQVRLGSLDGRHRIDVGYTWLTPEDLETNEPLVFRSRHLLIASGHVRPLPFLEAGAHFRYASRPERIATEFARFIEDADLFTDTRVLDLRLAADTAFWGADMTLGVLVKNALQHYYVERPALLAPPRRWLLQLRVRV